MTSFTWMRALRAAVLAAPMAGLMAVASPGWTQDAMPILARVGPWPVVSHLIGYQDRLWLANSVKGVNHNSADLYSYDPAGGALRYERHLFSQDAGWPVVAGGLPYWPFEDARTSLGFGHFMVTDGTRWQLGTIPTAQTFHTHAMAALDGHLIATTSAWRAGYQRSDDQGPTWREIYDHPTALRRLMGPGLSAGRWPPVRDRRLPGWGLCRWHWRRWPGDSLGPRAGGVTAPTSNTHRAFAHQAERARARLDVCWRDPRSRAA